jgi:hypothetical protein
MRGRRGPFCAGRERPCRHHANKRDERASLHKITNSHSFGGGGPEDVGKLPTCLLACGFFLKRPARLAKSSQPRKSTIVPCNEKLMRRNSAIWAGLDFRSGSKCEELSVSKSRSLCVPERTSMGGIATSAVGRKRTIAQSDARARLSEGQSTTSTS